MTHYVTLSLWDLALTSLLVLIDAGLSAALRLGIHRSLLIAAVRMVQLALIGNAFNSARTCSASCSDENVVPSSNNGSSAFIA